MVILNDANEIVHTISPSDYGDGAKLCEHAQRGDTTVKLVESLFAKGGRFYMHKLVWAGDYGYEFDEDSDDSLFSKAMVFHKKNANYIQIGETINSYTKAKVPVMRNSNRIELEEVEKEIPRYIVNHTRKEFIDREKLRSTTHPLPVLCALGNGKGGGDYCGDNMECASRWMNNIISLKQKPNRGYMEILIDFEDI